jgi:hypothetical protein
MRTIKVIRFSIILLAIISGYFSPLSAQTEDGIPSGMAATIAVPGYVILSNGDTVAGKVRWALKYVENNPVEIKFFAENGSSKSFKAAEIKGFGNQMKFWMDDNPTAFLMDMEHYVSIPSFKKEVPVFMNRLIDGRIKIYQNRSAVNISSGTTVTEKTRIDGIGFSFIPGVGLQIGPTYRTDYRIIYGRTRYTSYYIVKDNGSMIKVEKDNYDEVFKSLFGDCAAIGQELAKNPDLAKFKNFMILVEVYNRMCN